MRYEPAADDLTATQPHYTLGAIRQPDVGERSSGGLVDGSIQRGVSCCAHCAQEAGREGQRKTLQDRDVSHIHLGP